VPIITVLPVTKPTDLFGDWLGKGVLANDAACSADFQIICFMNARTNLVLPAENASARRIFQTGCGRKSAGIRLNVCNFLRLHFIVVSKRCRIETFATGRRSC
jgi:hypothetical protein